MTLNQALAALAKAGTAQNRKVYARHGVGENQYGVSYAELGKLRRAIGMDHDLALALWATGNHDARILACMTADPGVLGSREFDVMARELDNYVITDAFSTLVGRSPHAARKSAVWRDRRHEWTAAAAWNVLALLAGDAAERPDAFFMEPLEVIAARIHDRPNRVRHSMNQALISIGVRNDALHRAAVAVAARIGRVEVDHGETGCKTPDARAYMAKTLAHRARKKR